MSARNFDNKNAAHGADTPDRSTGEETPTMAASKDNIPVGEMIRRREARQKRVNTCLERLDETADLDGITRARIEMGISPLEIAAERLEEARHSMREAMKFIDCTEHRDLHLRLGNEVDSQDDLRALLMERCS
jgi:hypothetical protein